MSPVSVVNEQGKFLRVVRRLRNSIAKRLFWRSHLQDAIQQLENARSTLVTPEMFMTVPMVFRGHGYYRSLELKQNMSELLGLVNVLEPMAMRNVCEIGTFKGGTLYVWCQLASEDAHIVSIDLPGGGFGGGYNERSLPFFQSFRKPQQTLNCLRGNSHDPEVRNQLALALGGSKLDFLFIDGDHSYDGVKKDFYDYQEYVHPGGVIAFHDIVERPAQPDIQVWRFWNEVKQNYRSVEFVESGPERRKIGIGAIFKD